MASSNGRRKNGPGPPFGSRFQGLELDCEEAYPILSGKKRRSDKNNENIITNSFFSKSTRLSDLIDGPKFVVIKRNEDDETATMKFVNPFLIQKAIEIHAGTVKSIQRVRDGTILLETVSKTQAEKLYAMKTLGPNFKVNVFEHPRLNTSRGVVSCFDFSFLTDDEILEGLQSQHVVAIKRITRRIPGKPEPVNSQSAILTFNLPQLPEKVHLAFQSANVRPYIPHPLRCFKCQKYGHGSFTCKQIAICANCAEHNHGRPDECRNEVKCTNCNGAHPAWSRDCPLYVKEAEIQRIKTVEKMTFFEARQQYNIRFPNDNNLNTFSNMIQQNKTANHAPQAMAKPIRRDTNTVLQKNPQTSRLITTLNIDTNNEQKSNTVTLNHKQTDIQNISDSTTSFEQNTNTHIETSHNSEIEIIPTQIQTRSRSRSSIPTEKTTPADIMELT